MDLSIAINVIAEDAVVIKQVPFGLHGRTDLLASIGHSDTQEVSVTITAANLGASTEQEAVDNARDIFANLARSLGDDSTERLKKLAAWAQASRPSLASDDEEIGYEQAQEDVLDILEGIER